MVMYLKLALQSARRSVSDYLLYIFTLTILISVMVFSHYIAMFGQIQAGLNTVSLPILITLILVVLVGYMNLFLLKQRSKEFASYLLMGMEKNRLIRMFLLEFYLIGSGCFVAGCLLGLGIYRPLFLTILLKPSSLPLRELSLTACIGKTFFYFCLVEVLSTVRIRNIFRKIEIRELMITPKRNQRQGSKQLLRFLSILTAASLVGLIVLVGGIAFLPQDSAFLIISFIAVPMLLSIFFFYKWLFQLLAQLRRRMSASLFHGDRLYITAAVTSGNRTGPVMNGIFSMCLTFSAMTFIAGAYMLSSGLESDIRMEPDTRANQLWMGFLQISMCVIFLVIYFSMLSLQQILALRQEAADLRLLHYMGKNKRQIRSLFLIQTGIKLFLPAIMCLFILLTGVAFLNGRLNTLLPLLPQNMLVKSACGFLLCFLLLYLCYFLVVWGAGQKYIETARQEVFHRQEPYF